METKNSAGNVSAKTHTWKSSVPGLFKLLLMVVYSLSFAKRVSLQLKLENNLTLKRVHVNSPEAAA
jgi:hypothetical protein